MTSRHTPALPWLRRADDLGGLVSFRRTLIALVGLLIVAPATSATLAASAAHAAPHRRHHPAPAAFSFGIYPGGFAGGGSPDSKPDNRPTVVRDLDTLQGRRRPLVVREYTGYDGTSSSPRDVARFLPYLGHGRRLDLVAGYSGGNAPVAGYLAYVRNIVRVAGPVSTSISLGVDVNVNSRTDPSFIPAVAAGVVAAKQEARRLGYRWLRIGFDEVTDGNPDTAFWTAVTKAGGAAFRRSLDYVGVEVYPDVFRPRPGELGPQAVDLLASVRTGELRAYGFGRLPIHVGENGYATAPGRSLAEQAAAIRSEVTAIYANRARLGVDTYELFALRDSKSGTGEITDNFGLCFDDYRRKPSFDTYRHLLRALGARARPYTR